MRLAGFEPGTFGLLGECHTPVWKTYEKCFSNDGCFLGDALSPHIPTTASEIHAPMQDGALWEEHFVFVERIVHVLDKWLGILASN